MRANLVTGGGLTWVFADLVNRLRQLVPDLVVTERPQPDADVLHFWRPQLAVNIDDLSRAVLHCHGFGYWQEGAPIYTPAVMDAFARAAGVIVLNTLDEDCLRSYGVPDERIHLIPHAVDSDVFTERPDHGEGSKLCIGRVGRSYRPVDDPYTGVECKGRGTLREIMRCLQDRRNEIRWSFLGNGWGDEHGLALELGYESQFVVRTPDNYPQAFVAAYHDMDVYLVTSRAEGGPASLPEAMACGVWPVCTEVGMCVDLVTQISLPPVDEDGRGGNGRPLVGGLYPVNAVDRAVEIITDLLSRRHLLEDGRALLRSYVTGWGWEQWGAAHAMAYQSLARGAEPDHARLPHPAGRVDHRM